MYHAIYHAIYKARSRCKSSIKRAREILDALFKVARFVHNMKVLGIGATPQSAWHLVVDVQEIVAWTEGLLADAAWLISVARALYQLASLSWRYRARHSCDG